MASSYPWFMDKQTITPESKELALKHLDKLLLFVPPTELRKSVQATLFAYILEQDEKSLVTDFKKVVENHFFLIEFLDKLDESKG